ncbi:MAG TPA: dihydroneopterin aldolase family protein [Thermoplasmata archaeon]
MSAARDPLRGFFQCSDRERAIFEAGVKLGSVYHQFVGTPLDTRSVRALERAIEAGVRAQPNVQSVRARIDRAALRRGTTKMGYASLTGDMLDVTVTTRVGGSTAIGRLRYVASLKYPLMYIKRTS